MKTYFIIIIASIFLSSCEKEIKLDLNSSSPQLVIEGYITDQSGPYTVKLSKSVNFSESNNYPPVNGALVIISDNTGAVDTLTEVSSGLYQTHNITGTYGNTYTLKIVAGGKQYEAVSTMPHKVNLDSILFLAASSPGGSSDKTFEVLPIFTDPISNGNNYQFQISVDGKPLKSFLVVNDFVGNGSVNQQSFESRDNDVKISLGSLVSLTMHCVDLNTYRYYYALSRLSESGPDGGATPSNPPNNIIGNNALGIFSARTSQTKMSIVY